MTDNMGALKLLEMLENAGYEAYLVGGCVRDLRLGRHVHDFDVTTSATPDQVKALFPDSKLVGANFGVSLVSVGGEEFEVAAYRTDGSYTDNRRPDSVAFTLDVREDVKRRDFTVNALLMDSNFQVFDHVGGVQDLDDHVLRTVGNPMDRFSEDSLRMLRAVRFACQLGFALHEETEHAIKELAHTVLNVPAERLQVELNKMFCSGQADRAMDLLDQTGLLVHVLPEVHKMHGVDQNPLHHPEGDVFVHTRKLMSQLPKDCSVSLAWATLLHDVAKSVTAKRNETTGHNQFFGHEYVGAKMAKKILTRLKFPNEVVEQVESHVAQHMMFFNVPKMKRSKLLKFVRQENFRELLELNKFDSLASNGSLHDYEFTLNFLETCTEETLRPARLLTGNDLLEMGFVAGPKFKVLLEAVENAQLEGTISSKEEAVNLVNQMELEG
jgi:poly(A) polymerase